MNGKPAKRLQIGKLIICIAIPVAVGVVGGLFTSTGVDSWYRTIKKPSWNPPSYIFAPVWTTLYVMMGIALYLVRTTQTYLHRKQRAVGLFSIQLALNFFWSIIFFDQQQPGLALVDIILLWIFILLTIFAFAKVSKVAAWLLVPYISWVTFAAVLNFTIWKLNL